MAGSLILSQETEVRILLGVLKLFNYENKEKNNNLYYTRYNSYI